MDPRIYSYLAIVYFMKTSMATFCTIRNDGHCYYYVNCDVPARINIVPYCDYTDPYITLAINQSPTRNVTANFFNTLFDSYVRILLAVRNSWDGVHDNAFSNFENVMYADLSGNKIKTIGKAFKGLTQLGSLNLSRNYIEEISPAVFMFSETQTRLFLLDLSFNRLTYISDDVFVNIRNLKKLYLQGNKLETLGDQYFTNLKNLDYINLCCTNLTSLNMSLKHLTGLREINLSYNHIKEINMPETVSLETINLAHNDIEELNIDYFNQFRQLLLLDLSYNKLNKIYDSKSIKISNDYKPLIRIYLDHNNISYVDESFFAVFDYIHQLNLSYNQLTEFKPGTFKHVKMLKYLSISNCSLKINQTTFLGLNSTIMIDIKRNNITELDAIYFTNCTSLRRIEADFNQIKTVDTRKFMKLVPTLGKITLLGNRQISVPFTPRSVWAISVDLFTNITTTSMTLVLVIVLSGLLILLLYYCVHQRSGFHRL